MKRRKFIAKGVLTASGLALPSISFASFKSPSSSLQIYTSIPDGFPILSHAFKKYLIAPTSSRVLYNIESKNNLPKHPDDLISREFLTQNKDISFLSTIGRFLSDSDKRLALIENTPIIGKKGEGVANWLFHNGGAKYWQACARDWGYHVLPAMLVNHTDLGWLNQDKQFSYSNLRYRARGTMELFFTAQGSQKITTQVKELFHKPKDTNQVVLMQMLNTNIDTKWEQRISSFHKVPSGKKSGALLLGLYIPAKIWDSMPNSQQKMMESLSQASLLHTLKQTSFGPLQKETSEAGSRVKKDFQQFASDLVSTTSSGRKNYPLAKLFI